MGDIRRPLKGVYSSSLEEKYLILTLFVVVLFILFSGGFGIIRFVQKNLQAETENYCGDDTLYNVCSDTKPYFCSEGKLVERVLICGCPEGFIVSNNSCISEYQEISKTIPLYYMLHGERNLIEFTVYKGFADYIADIPRSISYSVGEDFSRADFTLNAINEEEQRKFLLPLVIKIQNITDDKEDQVRIAISIVQNIPFKYSNKTLLFGEDIINYSRYPYEVLYEYEGICGEKTDLLIFMLRELGYGVSFFYYPEENHEAVGIKCPVKQGIMESGYCFVETTGPSIITDDKLYYTGSGRLFSSPEIYFISEGEGLGKNIDEYRDADRWIRIRNSMEKRGLIGPIEKAVYDSIRVKYGLVENYYI